MLYLIQHGEAKSAEDDPERDLTDEGAEHARGAGRFLAGRGVVADAVWHSGKLRAEHTARIIAEAIGCEAKLAKHADLLPGDDPATVTAEIAGLAESELVLVGHLPFLARLTALLTGASQPPVHFRNAGIVALSRQAGSWAVEWAIPPELFVKEPRDR